MMRKCALLLSSTCKCVATAQETDMLRAYERAETLEQALRSAGVRMTRQRKAIVAVLASADKHPDADELYRLVAARHGSVSLSTVYRTMRVLEERGAIQRHVFADGRARFEHACSKHHDHLIDIDTGRVIEFRSEKIEQLQREIAAELGYDLVHHRLELYGRSKARVRAPKKE